MGLVKCKVCGKEVSETAPTCPHCGQASPGLNVVCPFCGSDKVTAAVQGFSAKKAARGAFFLGPLGVLAGGLGSKKEKYSCSACGKSWKP